MKALPSDLRPWLATHGGPILRFAVVGCLNAGIDLAVFAGLFYLAGWPALAAHAAGFSLAVINSYLLNKRWTFQDRSRAGEAWRRAGLFFLVALGGLGLSSLAIWLAMAWIPALAAKLLAIGVTFVWNYAISRRLVFRPLPTK